MLSKHPRPNKAKCPAHIPQYPSSPTMSFGVAFLILKKMILDMFRHFFTIIRCCHI